MMIIYRDVGGLMLQEKFCWWNQHWQVEISSILLKKVILPQSTFMQDHQIPYLQQQELFLGLLPEKKDETKTIHHKVI